MSARIAVVTGANRGIGAEISKQLARDHSVTVILTARDAVQGEEAAAALRRDGLDVIFHALDVVDPASVSALVAYLNHTHGGRCDILINNAGILLNGAHASVLAEPLDVVRRTMDTNLYGPLLLMQALVPLMRKRRYGRIVNLSSGLSQLDDMGDGYPAYRLSKAALNALTRMFADATHGQGILVNCACPGWVRTDMGGANATSSVDEGAKTAVWLATLPAHGPTGGLFRHCEPVPW